MISKTLFTFTVLLVSLLPALILAGNSVSDFCVADLSLPKTPSGYPCKNPANLTVDDFVYSGLGVKANSSDNLFNLGATLAFDSAFPGLNGLGLSMIRLDIGVNGAVPIHSHRVSELLIVIEGKIIAGFIGSDDTPYYKTLNKGDIIIFPQSLLHFQANIGPTPALCFASLNSANPGAQVTSSSLFGNGLPSDVIERISLVDAKEVKKLKRILGGSN